MSDLFDKSLRTLELPRVLELLSEQAVSAEAKRRALRIRPETEPEEVLRLLDQTDAARSLIGLRGSPSFSGVKPVAEALDRADRGGALNTRELLTIADLLTAARRAKEYFNADAAEKTAIDHLFLSLHSNAVSGGWQPPRGFTAFTSSGPETAERNQAATAILGAVKDAGVILFGTGKPYYRGYTVLTATTAPAVLLECGFHTNREDVALLKDHAYRDKLAAAIARGIMDYFGMEDQQPESGNPDQADPWAKDAWRKAYAAGIFDGTRPRDGLTRQEAAVVLDRLGLLEKGD